jgi:hypothetical protein
LKPWIKDGQALRMTLTSYRRHSRSTRTRARSKIPGAFRNTRHAEFWSIRKVRITRTSSRRARLIFYCQRVVRRSRQTVQHMARQRRHTAADLPLEATGAAVEMPKKD